MKKQVLVFVFDEFSESDFTQATSLIRRSGEFQLKVVGLELDAVISAGGLRVLPEADFRVKPDLEDIDPLTTAMLILPDGTAWEDKRNRAIMPLVRHCVSHQIPVAAIGGGTVLLADLGILNRVKHTSNHIEYLKAFSPLYDGDEFFTMEVCCHDRGIITAGAGAGMEFSEEVVNHLGLGASIPGVHHSSLVLMELFGTA